MFNEGGRGDAEAERNRHEFAEKKRQRAKDKLNENRMKQLGFINKRLHQKTETIAYINNIAEAMLKHYQVFAKRRKPLSPEPQLSNY